MDTTTTTTRRIVYWNGKVAKKWDGKAPLRMTEAQIEQQRSEWPEFEERYIYFQTFFHKDKEDGSLGNGFEPWMHNHGVVFWLGSKKRP